MSQESRIRAELAGQTGSMSAHRGRAGVLLGLVLALSLAAAAEPGVKLSTPVCSAPNVEAVAGGRRAALYAWAVPRQLWPQGAVLRVRFLDGSARQQQKAWARFQKIDGLVNLSFVNVTAAQEKRSAASDIRVTFCGSGHWSYLGTDARMATGRATMSLSLSANRIGGDFDDEWDRVVQHEVLHALGLGHEHQHPLVSIPWNKPVVYAYYWQTQGWSREQVDAQVLRPTGRAAGAVQTGYDPLSIMHYPVPREHTLGGFQIGWNRALSAQDKAFLKRLYP